MTSREASKTGLRGHLEREHRRLDELLGRFLGASTAGAASPAEEAIEEFDRELRRHTENEDQFLYRAAEGKGLAPRTGDSSADALSRQMRLEHVQVRELSGIVRRLFSDGKDLEGARRMTGRLARSWDAHTAREEREVFPFLEEGGGKARPDEEPSG